MQCNMRWRVCTFWAEGFLNCPMTGAMCRQARKPRRQRGPNGFWSMRKRRGASHEPPAAQHTPAPGCRQRCAGVQRDAGGETALRHDVDATRPYLKDSGVKIGGSVTVTVKSSKATLTAVSADGIATFEKLPCLTYEVKAVYVGANALIDAAVAKVGSRGWAYRTIVTSYDRKLTLQADTNKCSFFIYDMMQQIYGRAPIYTYARRFTFRLWTREAPALAGHWAERDNSATDKTKGWSDVTYKGRTGVAVAPGAILAISAD